MFSRRALLVALLLAGCVAGAACAAAPSATESRGPELRELDDVGELRAAFNRGRGAARLLLLLSPT